jgi:hypothetical protein
MVRAALAFNDRDYEVNCRDAYSAGPPVVVEVAELVETPLQFF